MLDAILAGQNDIGLVIIDPPQPKSPWPMLPKDGIVALWKQLCVRLGTQPQPFALAVWQPPNAAYPTAEHHLKLEIGLV